MDKLQAALTKIETDMVSMDDTSKQLKSLVDNFDKEIAILTVVEGNLVANINILRQSEAVIVAQLYKNARSDLNTCRTKAVLAKSNRDMYVKALDKSINNLNKLKEQHEFISKKIKEPKQNVVQVNFGKKTW